MAERNVPLKAIHVILEAEDGSETKLTIKPEGMFQLISQVGALAGAAISERAVEKLVAESAGEGAVTPEPATPKENEQITVSGRLKTQPKEGRPDRNGKPTTWALLAAHQEGSEQAKMYGTTFHRHTARIALGLSKDAQITVVGYPRANTDPASSRADSLSVFNILAYPGKPTSQAEP